MSVPEHPQLGGVPTVPAAMHGDLPCGPRTAAGPGCSPQRTRRHCSGVAFALEGGGRVVGMLPLLGAIVLVLLLPVSAFATDLPEGFVVYSRGDARKRILCRARIGPGMTEKQIRATERVICVKGDKGGDIQAQVSFDGKWVAFSRSLGTAPNKYGGDDYHAFQCWDVYVVRIDGKLPAEPIRIGHGYWPSWGDDSTKPDKTLYFSHVEGHARAATSILRVAVSEDGRVSDAQEAVRLPGKRGFEGFVMAAPNGRFAAVRYSGKMYAEHFAGPLAGRKFMIAGGCHPHITADSRWVFHAQNAVGRADGRDLRHDGDAAGRYHYGSSPDMQWFVSRTDGGAGDQNHGRDVWLSRMVAEEDRFAIERVVRITDDGSWVDVHTNGSPRIEPSQHTEVASDRTVRAESRALACRRTRDDEVFVWRNGAAANRIYDEDGKPLVSCAVEDKGMARPGRYHVMDLRHGGRFLAVDADGRLYGAVTDANALSVEALVTTAESDQSGPARIVSFSQDTSRRNFTLGQEGDQLVLRLRTTNTDDNGRKFETRLGRIEPGWPTHVVVSYAPGRLVWWIDGERHRTGRVVGDLRNWSADARLLFGDELTGGRQWLGLIEQVRLRSAVTTDEQADRRWRAVREMLERREAADPLVVEATLKSSTTTPRVNDLPYPDHLVHHVYGVNKVVRGSLEAERILVAQWAVLDGNRLDAADLRPGSRHVLHLESRKLHDQLKGYTAGEPEDGDALALPLYVDVGG